MIFEAFSKDQVSKPFGDPKVKEMLYSVEELKTEFKELKFQILENKDINLSEGLYHI